MSPTENYPAWIYEVPVDVLVHLGRRLREARERKNG